MRAKVHGNATAENTAINAARCLYAYGAPETVRVYPGAARPLLRAPRHDPEIHGADGLGGVVGLPDGNDPRVRDYLARKGNDGAVVRALEGMSNAIQTSWREGNKVSVVSSGPMTNIALFVSAYPDLLEGVEEFVFMGGGVGLGNRSAVAGKAFKPAFFLTGLLTFIHPEFNMRS
jgi:inosine-uridine nucleoside N-ribohydrolase